MSAAHCFSERMTTTTGRELWKSDGTEAGTVLVKDINPSATYGYPRSSDPQELTDVDGTLFFRADDGANGQELWKSDGTEAGTVLVKDIEPGVYGSYPLSSSPLYLTNVDGTLFFSADDGSNGRELWKSDGTTLGTVLVKDINRGSYSGPYGTFPYSSQPSRLVNLNGTLFLRANDGVHGYELWKSDGTETGTMLVKDINPGVYSGPYGSFGYGSYPTELTSVNGMLFFGAYRRD